MKSQHNRENTTGDNTLMMCSSVQNSCHYADTFQMITQENRFKLWKLIRKIAYKHRIFPPDDVYDEYNDCMKVIEGNIRYIIIEYYNLDTIFTYEAYEEIDLNHKKDKDRMAEIYEDFFSDKDKDWNTVLLIDLKTMKPYYLSKEVKENKKSKLEKVKYLKKLIK